MNLIFGIVLKKLEDGKFRYFYAHENNTLLDRSNFVCTKDEPALPEEFLNKTDVIEFLLKDIPMGCKNAVLHEPLLKNHTVTCLTFQENTRQPYKDNFCPFRFPTLHLNGNQKLEEETSKNFTMFMIRMAGITSS